MCSREDIIFTTVLDVEGGGEGQWVRLDSGLEAQPIPTTHTHTHTNKTADIVFGLHHIIANDKQTHKDKHIFTHTQDSCHRFFCLYYINANTNTEKENSKQTRAPRDVAIVFHMPIVAPVCCVSCIDDDEAIWVDYSVTWSI